MTREEFENLEAGDVLISPRAGYYKSIKREVLAIKRPRKYKHILLPLMNTGILSVKPNHKEEVWYSWSTQFEKYEVIKKRSD